MAVQYVPRYGLTVRDDRHECRRCGRTFLEDDVFERGQAAADRQSRTGLCHWCERGYPLDTIRKLDRVKQGVRQMKLF
jgi:transposase-like protein